MCNLCGGEIYQYIGREKRERERGDIEVGWKEGIDKNRDI